MQTAQPFNAVDLGGQFRQQRRLVTTACANLQYTAQLAITIFYQQFKHAGDHVWLADSLAKPDGQTGVFIGLVDQCRVNEPMAFDLPQGGQHTAVAQPLCGELLHHASAHCFRVHP